MKVRSLRVHSYGRKYHAKGSVYEIKSVKDAEMLCKIGTVKIEDEKSRFYSRKDQRAENLSQENSRRLRSSSGNYNRKDLRAEGQTLKNKLSEEKKGNN